MAEETIVYRIVGDSRSGVKAAKEQVSANKQVQESTHKTSNAAKTHAREAVAANALLTGSFRSMARQAVTAGAATLGAYLAISKGKEAVKQTLELAHATKELSRNLGLTEKSASAVLAVAKSRGIAVTSLGMGFQTLAKNAELATQGSVKQEKAFRALGITQDDLVKGQTDFAFLLGRVADGFGQMEGGATRAATAQTLLARGYRSLLPLFAEGRDGFIAQLQAAEKYGAVLDEKTFKQTEKLVVAQREMKLASLGMQIAFTQVATPALLKLSKAFEEASTVIHGPGSFDDKLQKLEAIVAPALTAVEGEFKRGIPKLANAVGHDAPKVAQAFGEGFIHADVWGKLALGAFLVSKLIGWKVVFAHIGTGVGSEFAAAFSTKAALAVDAQMAEQGVVGAAASKHAGKMGSRAGRAFAAGFITLGLAELAPDIGKALANIHVHLSHHGLSPLGGWKFSVGYSTPSQTEAQGLYPSFPTGSIPPLKKAGGGFIPGSPYMDGTPIMASGGEFVVTGGGEQMLESMTFPGVLDWLGGVQPPHFATGGRVPTFDLSGLPGLDPIPKNSKGQDVLQSKPSKGLAPHGTFLATAYGPPWTGINGSGITRTGVDLRSSPHVPIVAVDPSVIPLHSKLHVWPNPFGQKGMTFLAEDTGSAIRGHRLDFYDWKGRQDQMAFGRQRVAVSMAGSGRKGASPLVQYGSELVNGPIRPELRTLRGPQIDRQRLLSGLTDSPYSTGFDVGLAGGAGVYDILPDVLAGVGVGSVRTHVRQRTLQIFGGKAKNAAGAESALRAAASSISSKHYPYKWGGGHAGFTGPYDCSGAQSAVLHAAGLLDSPLTSGGFMNWGAQGPGKFMTLYSGPSHVFSKIGGRYFGTSRQNPGGGAGWFSRFPGMPPGGVMRHPPGLRKGGRVGYASGGRVTGAVPALTGLGTLDNTGANRILKALVGQLADASYGSVIALVHRITAEIKSYMADKVMTPGEQAKALRLRGALTLAQGELGRKLGTMVGRTDAEVTGRDTAQTTFQRSLRAAGIDSSGIQGLGLSAAYLARRKATDSVLVAQYRGELAMARDKTTRDAIMERLTTALDDLDETSTQIAENTQATAAAVKEAALQAAEQARQALQDANSARSSAIGDAQFFAGLTPEQKAAVAGAIAPYGIQSLPGGGSLAAYLGDPAAATNLANSDIATLMEEVNSGQIGFADVWPQIVSDLGVIAQATTQTAAATADMSEFWKNAYEASQLKLAISQSQYGVFAGFNAGPLPFLGGFDSGGIVPGPRGMAGLALVHSGETISPTHKPTHIRLTIDGSLAPHIDSAYARVDRGLGRNTRQLSVAPGGAH